LGFKFPANYQLFLQMTNGAEFAEAVFWSTTQLGVLNVTYQFPVFAPWFAAIGSNGAGEAIGYLRDNPEQGVFAIALVGMNEPCAVANSFLELLKRIAAGGALLSDDVSS